MDQKYKQYSDSDLNKMSEFLNQGSAIQRLHKLDSKWCWSVGKTRISQNLFECRIFPREQKYRRPTIISTAASIQLAVEEALKKLGSQEPE